MVDSLLVVQIRKGERVSMETLGDRKCFHQHMEAIKEMVFVMGLDGIFNKLRVYLLDREPQGDFSCQEGDLIVSVRKVKL